MSKVEKPTTDKAVALFENLTPDKVYTPGGVDAILAKITDEVRKTVIDATTKAGRDAAKSLAYKVARSKTLLDEMGKTLVADWKAASAKVDAERKTIRDRLEILQDEVKKPVEEWETAEADRVAGHINAITAIEDLTRFDGEPSSSLIADRLAMLETLLAQGRDWQEFADQAVAVRDLALLKLADMKASAIKREADAAELEALRAEKAARDQKDREEQSAREAVEAARAAEDNRKRQEAEATEQAAQAARDAVEAERKRVADQAAADKAAAEKRERNKKHREKVITAAAQDIFQACGKECDLIPGQARCIVEAIAAGKIPNVSISF